MRRFLGDAGMAPDAFWRLTVPEVTAALGLADPSIERIAWRDLRRLMEHHDA